MLYRGSSKRVEMHHPKLRETIMFESIILVCKPQKSRYCKELQYFGPVQLKCTIQGPPVTVSHLFWYLLSHHIIQNSHQFTFFFTDRYKARDTSYHFQIVEQVLQQLLQKSWKVFQKKKIRKFKGLLALHLTFSNAFGMRVVVRCLFYGVPNRIYGQRILLLITQSSLLTQDMPKSCYSQSVDGS